MTLSDATSTTNHHVRLDAAGRLVIPAELRRRWHVEPGDTLVLTEEGGAVRIRSAADVIRDSQDDFSQFLRPGESLVDELLAERRDEAARGEAEAESQTRASRE